MGVPGGKEGCGKQEVTIPGQRNDDWQHRGTATEKGEHYIAFSCPIHPFHSSFCKYNAKWSSLT